MDYSLVIDGDISVLTIGNKPSKHQRNKYYRYKDVIDITNSITQKVNQLNVHTLILKSHNGVKIFDEYPFNVLRNFTLLVKPEIQSRGYIDRAREYLEYILNILGLLTYKYDGNMKFGILFEDNIGIENAISYDNKRLGFSPIRTIDAKTNFNFNTVVGYVPKTIKGNNVETFILNKSGFLWVKFFSPKSLPNLTNIIFDEESFNFVTDEACISNIKFPSYPMNKIKIMEIPVYYTLIPSLIRTFPNVKRFYNLLNMAYKANPDPWLKSLAEEDYVEARKYIKSKGLDVEYV